MKIVTQPILLQNSSKLDRRILTGDIGNFNVLNRPCDLSIIAGSSAEPNFRIIPGQGLFNTTDQIHIVWINGVLYEVPFLTTSDVFGYNRGWVIPLNALGTSSSGIDSTNLVAGTLDSPNYSIGVQNSSLVWAVANDSNTEFLGFGTTRLPRATFTAVTNGGLGSICTLTLAGTGDNQAFRFTPGAYVTVRNETGTPPGFQWNIGRVHSIPNNTTLNVQLQQASGIGATLINGTTNSIVQQWNHYRCFKDNGSSNYDENCYHNARMIGKIHGNSSDRGCMSVNETWYRLSPINLNLTASTATTTADNVPIFRYVPPWTEAIQFSAVVTKSATGSQVLYGHGINGSFIRSNVLESNVTLSVTMGDTLPIPKSGLDGLLNLTITKVAGAGTVTLSSGNLLAYQAVLYP